MYKMDVRPLLKAVLDQFFGKSTGFVDMIVEHIPPPDVATAAKVRDILLGATRPEFWLSRLNGRITVPCLPS